MKKEPLLIAFASPKGEVEKSAFTVLVASILHYQKRSESGCRGLRIPPAQHLSDA